MIAYNDVSQDKPTIVFYAHLDTVPVDPEEKWDVDPFGGEVKESRIYGRGACDMKGAIASLVIALQTLEEIGAEVKFNLQVLLTTDEELGIPCTGLCYIADGGYLKGNVVWNLDGSIESIDVGALGAASFIISVFGKSGHSAKPLAGINAIESTVPILSNLMQLKKKIESRTSSLPFRIEEGPVRSRLNINVIRGGVKANITPAECEITIDRRYLPEEKKEDVIKEFLDFIIEI